jgi:predicted transcriptional regulator
MAVFFVHDVGKGIVTPLDRKFRVRDIPPTEELSDISRVHPKNESNPDDFKEHPQHKRQRQAESTNTKKRAISAYLETKPVHSPLGRVKNIMSSPVLSINKDKNLEDAWRIMQKYEIHHLVILDDNLKYCGMLSEKRIVPFLMNQLETQQALSNSSLENFCQDNLLSTHPNTQVEDLAPALLEYGLDSIAVFENQQIVGIVTYSDIMKVILQQDSFDTNA